jgi:hypothetical protein
MLLVHRVERPGETAPVIIAAPDEQDLSYHPSPLFHCGSSVSVCHTGRMICHDR